MASNAKFCSQCASPLPEPNPPFCSQCGAAVYLDDYESEAQYEDYPRDNTVPLMLNAILGFFGLMGIGHFVRREIPKGVFFLVAGWAGLCLTLFFGIGQIGLPLYIGVWVWSLVDAWRTL